MNDLFVKRRMMLAVSAAALTPTAPHASLCLVPRPASRAPDRACARAEADHWLNDVREKTLPTGADTLGNGGLMSKQPIGPIQLGRFADPMYFLLNPIGWKPGPGQDPKLPRVQVPKGFVTDLASIPQIFWSLLRPDGRYTYAAVIHDYLYWQQRTSRAVADEIFRLCMSDFDVADSELTQIHLAVRAGGGGAWRDNAKRRKAGERRVLIRWPEDPRVNWQDWRQEPKVFG